MSLLDQRRALTVAEIVTEYRDIRQPLLMRPHSARAQNVYLTHWVLPKWAKAPMTELDSRTVELWLRSIPEDEESRRRGEGLAPKSKGHVRSAISCLWEYAMWSKHVPQQPNPMVDSQCRVPGISSVKVREAVKLTIAEFSDWVLRLGQPFRAFAFLSLCNGLRGCEVRALKWLDVNWLMESVAVDRSIVEGHIGKTKTRKSKREMPLPTKVVEVLKVWHGMSSYTKPEDWIFASPKDDGRIPISYSTIYRAYLAAARKIGLSRLGLHSLRHSFGAWLDAAGTKPRVQKELMRHERFDTTFETYGGIITDEERQAVNRVANMVFVGVATATSEDEAKG
jgi:integrase